MTLTTKTMEWLNQNRYRSYPLNRDDWRMITQSRALPVLDCVILDALVFDPDSNIEATLSLERIKVEKSKTNIVMKYAGEEFSIDLYGMLTGDDFEKIKSLFFSQIDEQMAAGSSMETAGKKLLSSILNPKTESDTLIQSSYINILGEEMFNAVKSNGVFENTLKNTVRLKNNIDDMSFEPIYGMVKGQGRINASISLIFSSHQYILSNVGEGEWIIGCPILKSRTICLSNGFGVSGIMTNGSDGVVEHSSNKVVTGDVILEDGFRTSPIIKNGKVLVRVGTKYGYDPCKYKFEKWSPLDCRNPLFYFCGQNAINGGDISILGGNGISITQGRTYTVEDEDSKCNGMTIPCIEIVATKELSDICSQS